MRWPGSEKLSGLFYFRSHEMSDLQDAIAANRRRLKAVLRLGDMETALTLAGVIVGHRILTGEIPVKLPPIPPHLQ